MKPLDYKKLTMLLAAVLALVMVLLTVGNYFLLDRSGRGQSLVRWHGQVEDRARLLIDPFAQAVRRLEQARDDALGRAQGQKAEDSPIRYAADLEQRPDGTVRAKADKFDAAAESGVFVAPGMEVADALKHRIVTMRDTVNLFGQSWLKEYPNLWFAGAERWLVAYFPDYPWTEKLDASFDPTAEVWYRQATSERNAKKAAVWGAAKRDAAGKSLVVSVALPVQVDGTPIGVMGADVSLKRLIEATGVAEHETGVTRLVVDAGDGIVALSGRIDDVLKAGAPVKPDKKMADIASAIEAVRAHGETTGAVEASGTILDPANKRAIVYAKVGNYPWTLVTIVPDTLLSGGAGMSSLVFGGISALAVLLVAGIAGFVIKRALAVPAQQLASVESTLAEVEGREKAAVKASEDLNKQLEEARKKSKALESEVAAAKAAAEAARAEAAAAAAASAAAAQEASAAENASAADVTAGTGTIPPEPGEETIASLELDSGAS